MKADAPLHNHRKVIGYKAKLDFINPGDNRARASKKGFPSVPAAPLYIIRRGKHVGSSAHLCRARTHRHSYISRVLREALFSNVTDAWADGLTDRVGQTKRQKDGRTDG